MDWRSVRFDWNRARAFLVTAEEGSLSAAARALEEKLGLQPRQQDFPLITENHLVHWELVMDDSTP